MKYAPIILFVYNRPWHTLQAVEALQRNELANESDLFVYADGPKSSEQIVAINEVRVYIRNIRGFKSVTIIERDENLGLARSIISGVTDIVNSFGSGIVLEDDLVTSPFFLTYMNTALSVYEKEDSVICIHGYVYPVQGQLPETFFLKGADCWGWGTWKRGWELFEADGAKLLHELTVCKLTRRFDFNGTHGVTRMLKDQITGKIDSWAVRWYASALLNNRLTLYPGRSLVQNIGNDNSGFHSEKTSVYDIKISDTPIFVELVVPQENKAALREFEIYFNSIQVPYCKRLFKKFKEIVGY